MFAVQKVSQTIPDRDNSPENCFLLLPSATILDTARKFVNSRTAPAAVGT
jgi:hypothetical protein